MIELVLDTENGLLALGENTLVFALDDSGNENFDDPNHPVFAIAGCGFVVRDFNRLIDSPWAELCLPHFPDTPRPLHASHMRFTEKQMDALAHFFTNFDFFRVGVTIGREYKSEVKNSVIEVVGASLLSRIKEVAKWAAFNRVFVMFEASDRLEARVMRSLSQRALVSGPNVFPIELATIPKSAAFSAMEVADFIAHTAGAQARTIKQGMKKERKDFQLIFKSVHKNLKSFMHITKARKANT